MSNTPNNPNSGQTTIIQPPGWKTRFQAATHWTKMLMIGMALFGGIVKTIEFLVNISQAPEAICSITSLCPPPPDGPEWIGTRIEEVYSKKLPNYNPDTTLVQTDKGATQGEKNDVSLLKNTAQDLSKLNGDKKNNSGQYEVRLRRYKSERKPVCIRIYGTRSFKNIILIRDFPPDKLITLLHSRSSHRQTSESIDFFQHLRFLFANKKCILGDTLQHKAG